MLSRGPKPRIELIETGRIKIDQQLVADLVKTYGLDLNDSPTLQVEIMAATQPAESRRRGRYRCCRRGDQERPAVRR